MKIIVYSHPFPVEPLKKLSKEFPECNFVYPENKESFKKELSDADAVVTLFLSTQELEIAKNLQWIQSLKSGVNSWPLKEIKKRGITLSTGRGIHKIHMAEYAISMMVIDSRQLDQFILNKSNKLWKKDYPQDQIKGKKLGIIGLGSIGQEIAKKANFMGMKVCGVKRIVEEVPYVTKVYGNEEMDVIFRECDYIINLLPHTKETDKIINKKYMEIMKSSACLINMGRGGTTNEDDLYEALNKKIFRKCISDVFTVEPLPPSSPLWNLDNIIITPHICGLNIHNSYKAYEILKQNIFSFINDKSKLTNVYSHKLGY